MPPPPPVDTSEEGAPAWMTTYGDMVTLLLTFFVMLFSLSTLEQQAKTEGEEPSLYDQAIAAIEQRFGGKPTLLEDTTGQDISVIEMEKGSQLIEELEGRMRESGIDIGPGRIEQIRGGYKLDLPGELLFEFGSADIRPEAEQMLRIVAETITTEKQYDTYLLGHTDNVPIDVNSDKFTDNLELSCIRASNVARFFIDECGVEPTRMLASGLGEWHPVDTNETDDGRANNRRVEVILIERGLLNRGVSADSAADSLQDMYGRESGEDTGSSAAEPAPAPDDDQ